MMKHCWSPRLLPLVALAGAFLALAGCSKGGGGDGGDGGGGGNGRGQGPGPRTGNGLNLNGRPLVLEDLDFVSSLSSMNWPAVRLSNEFRAESAPDSVVGYRFEAIQASRLVILAYMTSFRCTRDDDGAIEPEFALYTLDNSDRLQRRVTELESDSEVDLEPGLYAVTLAFPSGAQCQNVALGFEASLKIRAVAPEPTDEPEPSPTPNPRPSPRPNPTPRPTPSPTPSPQPQVGEWQVVSQDFGVLVGLSSYVVDLKNEAGSGPGSSPTQPKPRCDAVGVISLWNLKGIREVALFRVLPTANGTTVALEFATRPVSGSLADISERGRLVFLKQQGYPENWAELMLQDLVAGNLSITDSPFCAVVSPDDTQRDFLLATAAVPDLWPMASSWTSADRRLPIKEVTLSSGKPAPDMRVTYAYGAEEEKQWSLSVGLDAVRLRDELAKLELSEFNSVRWMVMDRQAQVPQSNWIAIASTGLLDGGGDRLVLGAEESDGLLQAGALRALLNNPSNRSIVLRIGVNNYDGRRPYYGPYADFVIDHGLMCQQAYQRTDGVALHERLFNDLTNPSWNTSPSRDNKTGCGFAGVLVP
jgi:hypothetical protein